MSSCPRKKGCRLITKAATATVNTAMVIRRILFVQMSNLTILFGCSMVELFNYFTCCAST
jgi:hypothetical protein